MDIIVEKAKQIEDARGLTCNSGSNNSGSQGSMCRGADSPLVIDDAAPAPALSE
ncbi:MAG TPA: hypothetical protein VNQ77_07945 [Frankiaceae bacterium]|nr:hypothetical protein [Frankiaceae bacterium]